LIGSNALNVIANTYKSRHCWCSYGSMVGLYADQIRGFDKSETVPRLLPRQIQWRWGHPRSFKVNLISHFKKSDFQDWSGNWVQKATDRGFIFRMIEMSGASRTCYISEKIYRYTTLGTPSTTKRVSRLRLKLLIQHFNTMEPSPELKELPAMPSSTIKP